MELSVAIYSFNEAWICISYQLFKSMNGRFGLVRNDEIFDLLFTTLLTGVGGEGSFGVSVSTLPFAQYHAWKISTAMTSLKRRLR